eukprot:Awhi_evm2s4356
MFNKTHRMQKSITPAQRSFIRNKSTYIPTLEAINEKTANPSTTANETSQILPKSWSLEKQQSYKESLKLLKQVDLTLKKMTVFDQDFTERMTAQSGVKVAKEWTKSSKVEIASLDSNVQSRLLSDSISINIEKVEYTAGGLAAVLQAFEHLHNDPRKKVVFSTDGQLSIMDRSGLQGHEHPTQYDEYGFMDLFAAMKNNILDNRNPETSNYKSLAMPLGLNMATMKSLPAYIRFFAEFVKQKFLAGNDVTEISKAAIRKQKKSLDNFTKIDNLTRAALGKPIMERHGRYYFAFESDRPKLMKGLRSWTKLGIESKLVNQSFLKRRTLFDLENESIHAYFMPNDSYFMPSIVETIVEYLQVTYPERFIFQGKAKLSNIIIDPKTNNAVAIKEIVDSREILRPVNSVFTSLGHDQVFNTAADKGSKGAEYKEIMATSSTGDWVQTISKNDLNNRIPEGMTAKEFLSKANLLPYADKYNIHVTPLSVEENDSDFHLYYRITEGGILTYESQNSAKGSNVTCKGDLINSLYKLNRATIGIWRPLTVGSCTRKIDVNN